MAHPHENPPHARLAARVLASGSALGFVLAGSTTEAPPAIPVGTAEAEAWGSCSAIERFVEATKIEFEDSAIDYIDIRGRYQGQFAWVEAEQGNLNRWESRRARLGVNIGFREKGRVFYDFQFGPDGDEPFFDIVDIYGAEWEFSKSFILLVGKERPKMTQEGTVSSIRILTVERSALTNAVRQSKSLGLWARGDLGKSPWFYNAGIYSGDGGDRYLHGGFNAGFGVLGSLGYKLSPDHRVRFDWFWQDGNPDNYDSQFLPFHHTVSLNSENRWGNFGLNTDLIAAEGDGVDDLWGLLIMPHYLLGEKIQLVSRYTYLGGEAESAQLYSRYQAAVTNNDGRGGHQHSIYLGVNYLICGDALKVMAGVEYTAQEASANGGGFDGFQYVIGLRTSF